MHVNIAQERKRDYYIAAMVKKMREIRDRA
jgi:hypothetical protein